MTIKQIVKQNAVVSGNCHQFIQIFVSHFYAGVMVSKKLPSGILLDNAGLSKIPPNFSGSLFHERSARVFFNLKLVCLVRWVLNIYSGSVLIELPRVFCSHMNKDAAFLGT